MVFKDCLKKASKSWFSPLSVFSQPILHLLILCRCYQCLAIKPSIRKNRRQNLRKKPDVFIFMSKDMFTLYWIAFLADGKIYPVCIVWTLIWYVTLDLRDRCRAASLRYSIRTQIFVLICKSPIRYSFCAGAKATRYSVNSLVRLKRQIS